MYYSWEQYQNDIKKIKKYIILENFTTLKKVRLVSLYRGSLPMGAHLSNLLKVPLSIVRFQTKDGTDKYPELVLNNNIENGNIIVLDDIYDSGFTMNKTLEYLKKYKPQSLNAICLFGDSDRDDVFCLNPNPKQWVTFPWERI